MKEYQSARFLVRQAILAAIYVVLTTTLPGFAYGPIQFRYSEVMTWLAFYDKKNVWGLTVGCFIANIWSPFGVWDMVFGTLGTLLAVWAMSRTKNKTLASLYPGLVAFIYGIEIMLLSDTPVNFFLVTGQIMIAQFIIVAIIGRLLFEIAERNPSFMNVIVDHGERSVNKYDY